jgi:hypothetical protein
VDVDWGKRRSMPRPLAAGLPEICCRRVAVMSKVVRISMAVAAMLILLAGFAACLAQTPVSTYASPSRDQIRGPIVEAETVTLYGNVHPMARAEFDKGAVDPGTRLGRMVLLLQPSPDREAAAANLAEAQQNPASPYYHKWISRADYASRFGASAGDVATVQGWLRSQGFKVENVLPGQRLIYFSGTAGQVTTAFHTDMHIYLVNGERHIANVQDPQIPRALAPAVRGLVSLHDFPYRSMLRTQRLSGKPQNTGAGTTGSRVMYPADFGVIYDLTSVWNANTPNIGAGVTIGIAGRSNIVPGDITTFRSTAHLAAYSAGMMTNLVDLGANSSVDPGLVTGDQDEATLDVEWSGAVAPGAQIVLAPAATSGPADGAFISAAYLVNTISVLPQIVSVSFGACEQAMGSTELAGWNTLWQEAALQGQTVVVSSGDSGAAGCDAGSATAGTEAGVNGICSSPYATCVGGTQFNDTASPSTYWNASDNPAGASAKSYIPELVWNESAANGGAGLWASGGGISLFYPQPAWQSVASATNGQRGVPDLALTAAAHDGYLGYETVNATPSWFAMSGTSAAAPSLAGIMALVSKSNSATSQGNVNPVLYGLVGSSSTKVAFNTDATLAGDNSVPGVPGYAATAGVSYNLATGLGSVDGAKLITQWNKSTGLAGFAMVPQSNSMSIAAGANQTLGILVSSVDVATPTVAMSYVAPSGVTVAFSSATVAVPAASSRSTTATVTVGANVQPGNYTLSFTGTAGSNTQTVVVALTVTATPELSLHAQQTFMQITAGGLAIPLTFNVSTGGSFTGNVTLAVTGLPTTVTKSWNPGATVTPVSNAATPILSLQGSSLATPATSTFTVTATGDGLTATDTITLQVMQAKTVQVTPASATISMTATGTVTDAVTVSTFGGLTGSTALTISAPPTGVSCSFSPSTINAPGSGISTLTCAGSPAVTATTFSPTITATTTAAGGPYIGTATIKVNISASKPSITFLSSAPKVNLTEGGTTNTVVSFKVGGTFSGTVNLAAVTLTGLGLPAGTAAAWQPAAGSGSSSVVTVSGGVATVSLVNGIGTATLRLTAPAAVANGALPTSAVNLSIKATGTTLTSTAASETMALTMLYSPQILVTPSAASLTMTSTGTAVETFTITPKGGYAPTGLAVTLPGNYPPNMAEAYTGQFAASGATISTNTTSPVTATVTITGSNNAIASAARNLAFVFAATDGSTTSSVPVTVPLTVTLAAPTLAVTSGTVFSTASPMTIQQGTSGSDAITVTAAGSFATGSGATLTLTGLPAGVTANWTSNAVTLTPSSSGQGVPDTATSTLTLTVAPSAVIPAGNTTITITPKDNATSAVACTCTALSIPLKLTYAQGLLVQPQAAAVSMASAGTSTSEVVKLTAEGTPSVLVPASAPVLTFSGLPSGVTATAGALSGSGPWTSTITLTGSNTAVATTQPAVVTVTATAVDASGNFYVNTGTFTLSLSLSAPTLSITAGSYAPTVVQGATVTDVFTINTGGSFNAPVALSVAGLPSGVTASWSANPAIPTYTGATGTVTSTLTLTAGPTAPITASPVSITVTAAGDSITATPATKVNLTVNYAPALQVSLSKTSATVDSATTGQSGTAGYQVLTVTVKGVGGVATAGANLSISGLPAGMTPVLSPSPVTGAGTSTLTLTGSNTVAPGPYTVTISANQATGTTGSGSATLALQVTQTAPALAISPTTANMALPVSGTATQAYTLTGSGSYTGAVTMAVLSGLPAHVTASWSNPNPATMTYNAGSVTSTGSSTLTLTADASAAVNANPVSVTITATGDGIVMTSIVHLTITAAGGITASPAATSESLTVPSSSTPSTVTDLITFNATGGFPANAIINVSAAVAGSPTGVTATMCSPTVTFIGGTGTCLLTLSVDQTASTGGPYAVTVTGTGSSGSPVGTATVNLTVGGGNTLSVGAQYASATVYIPMSFYSMSSEAAASTANLISVTTGGGFSGNVTLAVSGLPSGVTASWSTGGTTSTVLTPSANAAASTLTLTGSGGVTAGGSTITITATGSGLTQTTTVSLTAMKPAMYVNNYDASPSALSISGGPSLVEVSRWICNSPQLSPAGTVTVTLSGLPAGVTGGPFAAVCGGSFGLQNLTLTPNSSTATPGTATVTWTATSGAYSASYSFLLTVNP